MDFKFNPFTGTFDLVNSASAGTGTSSNTPNTLVLRDGSGNFSAGTITAALTGAASNNVLKAGDIMTGVLQVTSGTASLPGISISGDTDTGLYSPGANQLGFATSGTGRILLDADGNVTIQNQKEIRFADSDSSNYVSFKAPSTVTTNVSWTLPSTDGTTGQLLSTNGAGILSWATATGGGSSVNYQEFTSSGTWTKPAGATFIYIECVGGGGGGGSGRRGAAGTVRCGGGGGASGKWVSRWIPASLAGSTETVTVGAGGTGGAAVTTNDTNGGTGFGGGSSSFGSILITSASLSASGGSNSSGTGGSYSYNGFNTQQLYGTAGRDASSAGNAGIAAEKTSLGPGGGGSGGGIPFTDGAQNGGAGGQGFAELKTSAAGQTTTGGTGSSGGTAGGSGASGPTFGDGGGGGASSTTAASGAGGNGAFPGGGGGGGAASVNGFNSGKGGNGGGGYVRIWTW